MAKLKQLLEAIKVTGYMVEPQQISKHWIEVKQMIEQITPDDFAVTYDKDASYDDIPLFRAMRIRKPDLAELIIKKNPVFAAKLVDNIGFTGLHHACCCLQPSDALKIVNLLIPYMCRDAITSRSLHDPSTFLHLGVHHQQYKVAASISPELLSVILKSSSTERAYSSLVKFICDAVQVYDMEISQHPEIADNYFRKGVILQGMGKNEKAIKCYQKAIQLDPNYADKIEGIELSTLPAPGVVVTDTSVQDDRELMKAKISELTQELSKLLQKTTSLAEEVTFLRGSLKVVEEHKGQASAEPPSYEEEVHVEAPTLPASLPPDIALMGSVDTCDITLHF